MGAGDEVGAVDNMELVGSRGVGVEVAMGAGDEAGARDTVEAAGGTGVTMKRR